MHFARAEHTATLLANGNVLVVGGRSTEGEQARSILTAEIYDPRTERWQPTFALKQGRIGHAVIPLSDDRILVFGGGFRAENEDKPLAAAEICQLHSATCEIVRDSRPRFFPAVLVLGDRVLVVGGSSSFDQDDEAAAVQQIQVGNLKSDAIEWVDAGVGPGGSGPTLTALDNKHVLFLGEAWTRDKYLSVPPRGPDPNVGVLSLATGHWRWSTHSLLSRRRHTATKLGVGTVLMTGGSRVTTLDDFLEVNPVTLSVQTVGKSSVPREYHSATRIGRNKVLVAGGLAVKTVGGIEITDTASCDIVERR